MAEARYQSAVAVNIAIRSPTPARLSSGGAARRMAASMSSVSGQRAGVVRLTPRCSSTENESA